MADHSMNNPREWGWLFDRVSKDVEAELIAAVHKHGYEQTPMNPAMLDTERLIILVEEVGEVARAMTYDEGERPKLRKELIQVAAMALGWVIGTDGDR